MFIMFIKVSLYLLVFNIYINLLKDVTDVETKVLYKKCKTDLKTRHVMIQKNKWTN